MASVTSLSSGAATPIERPETWDPRFLRLWDHFHSMPTTLDQKTHLFWRKYDQLMAEIEPPPVIQKTKSGRLICPSCPETYAKKKTLKHHVRTIHTNRDDLLRLFQKVSKFDKLFPCPFIECSVGYTQKHHLLCHLGKKHLYLL